MLFVLSSGESLSAWVDVGMSRLSYCEGVVLKECLAQERRDEETLQVRVILYCRFDYYRTNDSLQLKLFSCSMLISRFLVEWADL